MHVSDSASRLHRPLPWATRLAGLTLLLLAAACAPMRPAPAPAAEAARTPRTPVILISIDGMRPDDLDRGVTPHLSRMATRGVRAEAMMPSFPSKTFPNHYSLVTGLRPDHHGVVDNTMEDARIPGVRFTLSNAAAVTDRRWWDQAEPVWVTAEKQNVRTATMFWPGSEAAIQGVRPTRYATFDGKVSANARTDMVLSWLDRGNAEGFGFVTLYFDDVDHAGHEQGPGSPMVMEALAKVDRAVGRLIDGLAARKLDANIVVVSDHGMAPVSASRVVRIDQMLPTGSYRVISSGPFAGIEPVAGREAELAQALLQAREHVQCWRKADIPGRLVYGKNARVPSYFCLAETGWTLAASEASAQRTKGGAHGYDPQSPDMHATFIAWGPAFRNGVVLPAFDNVDVYPLLMQLLGLKPLPSDGKVEPLLPALR